MAPQTYDITITFRSAANLPAADLSTLSSDPYISATLTTPSSQRSPARCPPLRFRTPTARGTTAPAWECRWDVANVPREGTRLALDVLDEDARNHDDRLGRTVLDLGALEPGGVSERAYGLRAKGASRKAVVLGLCVRAGSGRGRGRGRAGPEVVVRVEVRGETRLAEGFEDIGRAFTAGPNYWSKHFSPLIGKVVGTKDSPPSGADTGTTGTKATAFSFEANKLQLRGPLPPALHHRYVDFAPFVTAYFSRAGLQGRVLNRALHSQYRHLYCHDPATEYGLVEPDDAALARRFLQMAHWADGHRIFTYVLTLDAEWRFTETGDEFAVDLLSKHSLHSDVSKYIAYSGEFFVRKLPQHASASSSPSSSEHDDDAITPPHDDGPAHYELVIDNDSGTYRPAESLLPQLRAFLAGNLHGLGAVTALHCFDEELVALKRERKEAKKRDDGRRVFRQHSRGSSISSSDEEELETGREGNVLKRAWGRWMLGGGVGR